MPHIRTPRTTCNDVVERRFQPSDLFWFVPVCASKDGWFSMIIKWHSLSVSRHLTQLLDGHSPTAKICFAIAFQ